MATTPRIDAPSPERPALHPPRDRVGAARWARENLFSTWYNTLLTIAFGALVAWVLYQAGRWVFVGARWEIIQRNLRLLLLFRFPAEAAWSVWAAMFLLAASFGVASGAAVTARRLAVASGRGAAVGGRYLGLRRAGPPLLLVAVLLWLGDSLPAVLLVVAAAAVWFGFRLVGARLPARWTRWALAAAVAGLLVAFAVVVVIGGVGWEQWGGLLLTAFLALAGIVLSFPLGVLLALGRRSSLPAVRLVCVSYIELIRGVPLITLLFMGFLVIGFFLPPGFPTPSVVTRALIAFVLFTAAYIAEIVRGGLQAVPRGQVEAAQALGLSAYKTTRLVLLPQALRAVIPALVGQFISLFKDTSLVFIIGVTDLLGVATTITKQPDFIAQGLVFETLVFVSFIYWVGSYSMSRESQRLERRLGVGER